MENKDNQSRIESLKKGLYSRTADGIRRRIPKLSPKQYDVKSEWQEETTQSEPQENFEMSKKKNKKRIILERLLLGSVIFLFITGILAMLNIFGGFNRISTANVDISAVGPASIESGGELSLQITITNNNATDLELADLIIEYPKGTFSAENKNKEINIVRETLDTIPAGRSVRREVKAVLYGEENSNKEIIISLEYRIAGSNAIFFKDRKYEIKISSSPINLIVSPIEEVISGQEVEFVVSVVSNAENPIKDLLLSAEYPFGFQFISAIPNPTYGDNVWEIKDTTAEKTTIRIKGKIEGQDEEERVFRFESGTKSENDEKEIGALFASLTKSVIITKPFLGIDLAINGDSSPEYISSIGKSLRVDVIWSNNSQSQIVNGEIVVKLVGDVLDKNSVSVDKGFYRSSDNTIVWNSSTNGELSEIALGDNGRFSFSFEPKDISSSASLVNPKVSININAKGTRVSEIGSQEVIESSVSRLVKFNSDLMVSSRSTYYSGPFQNTGSIPPKADEETTYTITWTATNSSNDISNAKVSASLPSYIRWMGVVSPTTENISYSPVGGEIVWNVGDVKAGTGLVSPAKEISFQVALLPSISQVGTSPDLTNDVNITGTDRFTNRVLNYSARGVSTRLSTDPGYTSLGGIVVE